MNLFQELIKDATIPGVSTEMDVILQAESLSFTRNDQGLATGNCKFNLLLPGDGQIVVGSGVVGVPCSPEFEETLRQAILYHAKNQLGVK